MPRKVLHLLVLLLFVTSSFQKCNIVKDDNGIRSYNCESIDDLEVDGTSELLNVTIQSGDSTFRLGSSIPNPLPNLKIELTEQLKNGLDNNVVKSLKTLKEFFTLNNRTGTLNADFLKSLPIKVIHLRSNGIHSISPGTFSNLNDLEELYITEDHLNRIRIGIFSNLHLETLSLANNDINVIERNAFEEMGNLKNLYLNGNLLTEFQPELLITYRYKLLRLSLNDNRFTVVDRNIVRGLDNLRYLNLEGNRISTVFSYTFENAVNLETLLLSNNLLLTLESEVFPGFGLPNLKKFSLADNSLSYFSIRLLERLRGLEYISIGGNPWQCPCLETILDWFGEHNIKEICDEDYYTGKRPVCLVIDEHPTSCNYRMTNQSYIYKFKSALSKFAEKKPCVF